MRMQVQIAAMSRQVAVVVVACIATVSLMLPTEGYTQSFASAPLARVFSDMLENASLEAFAAADPDERGRFIAALNIHSGALLVVSARQPSAEAIKRRIQDGAYHDVYLDLQATPSPEGKFFVQDSNGDGLRHVIPGSNAVDVVYEDGTRTTAFNGDPEGQQLSTAEYDLRFRETDRRYAHALDVLTRALAATRASHRSDP
jgi:hypothetical protein